MISKSSELELRDEFHKVMAAATAATDADAAPPKLVPAPVDFEEDAPREEITQTESLSASSW